MRKFYLGLSLGLCLSQAIFALPTQNISVFYFNAASLNNGLPQQACEQMTENFNLNVQGNHYIFSSQTNPRYSNFQRIAYLPLDQNSFLEVDEFNVDFKYQGKTYNIPTHLTCYINSAPFLTRCIYNNQYCRADSMSVFNSPILSEPPELLKTNVPS